MIQTWGGVKELRVDNLTGSSHYNNLYLRRENSPLGPAIGPVTLDHVNLFGYVNPSGWDIPATLRAMSIGTQPADTDCDAAGNHCGPSNDESATNCQLSAAVNLIERVRRPAGRRQAAAVHVADRLHGHAGCASRSCRPMARAPPGPRWTSTVRCSSGPPPGGDFVPAGSVGLGYTSPGYQTP